MFMPNWSAKVEYLYYDLGGANFDVTTLATGLGANAVVPTRTSTYYTNTNITNRVTGNIARAGVNYHLSLSPSAIVAKY
jgi:outer membrane immunogenic protein